MSYLRVHIARKNGIMWLKFQNRYAMLYWTDIDLNHLKLKVRDTQMDPYRVPREIDCTVGWTKIWSVNARTAADEDRAKLSKARDQNETCRNHCPCSWGTLQPKTLRMKWQFLGPHPPIPSSLLWPPHFHHNHKTKTSKLTYLGFQEMLINFSTMSLKPKIRYFLAPNLQPLPTPHKFPRL